MLSTKNIVSDYKDIPVQWVFEHYCNLTEKLEGQTVSICSMFSEKDLIPSMKIYDSEKGYRFKDFSSGFSGSCWDLLILLTGKSFSDVVKEVKSEYMEQLNSGRINSSTRELSTQGRYRVTAYEKRGWDRKDADFWLPFNIGTKILRRYNVYPLDSYRMTRPDYPDLDFKTGLYYGYFTQEDVLIKIYQPHNKELKFLNVNKYLQGKDQLLGYDNLCIVSSLKDIMSCVSLGLKVDYIAPDSENTFLSKEIVDSYVKEYKYVSVMLDNDEPGIKAMKKYKTDYGLTPLLLDLSKDPSDSIRDHGPRKVLSRLVPLYEKLSLAL